MKYQRGVGLNGLLIGAAILGVLSLLAMKVLPEIIEYRQITKIVLDIANDSSLKEATVAQIREKYDKRAEIDNVKKITAQEIEISKDGNELEISFSYSSKVHLFANVSLMFDFEGSSAKK